MSTNFNTPTPKMEAAHSF